MALPFSVFWQQNFYLFNFLPVHCTLWDGTGFSLHTMSATDGRQILRHSWMCCTPMCSTYMKHSTADLLTVKWIQLLLIFSWGFQPWQRVVNLDPVFDSDPICVRTKVPMQEFPTLSILVSCCTTRTSAGQVRDVRKVLELFELLTQSELGDT